MPKSSSIILALLLTTLSFTVFGCNSSTSTTVDELNLEIAKLEKEIENIKEYQLQSYEVRNLLDIESRKIYKAFANNDIDTLKEKTIKNTVFFHDEVIFTYDNSTSYIKFDSFKGSPILRQRWYDLSSDYRTFTTGYEIIHEDSESIPVINFTFVIEDGAWKLCFITNE